MSKFDLSVISRAIPGLFGGVSQQIPAMRHQTQCAEQENGLSTVVDGLYKRPGSKHITQLPNTWAAGTADAAVGNVHCHVIDRGVGRRWQLVLGASDACVVNLETGATEAVQFQDEFGGISYSYPSYLTDSNPAAAFRCITVADTTFLVNTNKTVTNYNGDASAANSSGYVYVKAAVGLHTYTVWVNGAAASHTTTATTTVGSITSALITAINALGGGRAAYPVADVNGVIQIIAPGGMAVKATDTYGNTTMTVLTNGVQKFSDLPPAFVTSVRLTIIGSSAGGAVDPYYVTYNGTQWVETRAYGITTDLTSQTMPFRMYKSGATWVIRPIQWVQRKVGDESTNPMPSFVGRSIRDIFFYRNRLGFLSGDSCILSRAGDYYNFFSSTAIEVLDSDPIDLGGSAESVDSLDWAVPFNKQLIIWASNKQQFSLAAGEILSPDTARLEPVTAFESINTARPRQLGNRVVFPSTINGFTQLSLYRVSMDTISNTAEPITDHIPTYIPISPRSIELSETAKVLAVVHPGNGNALYVFKYEDDGDKLTQRAWQRFTFKGGVVKAHWSGQTLYLTMLYKSSDPAGGHHLCLEAVDFAATTVDPSLSFGMRMDRRVFVNGATATGVFGEVQFTATLPSTSGLEVYRYVGASDPVKLEVVSTVVNAGTPTTVTFKVKAPDTTGTFVVGQPYRFQYTFTETFMRDAEGVPVMDARLKLLKMGLRYVKTGFFKALVTTKAQGSYEYPMNGQGVGLLGQLLGALPVLVKGDFSIPVHAQAEGTTVTIQSDSHLPCCFPYAEWRGNINMKSKR